MQQIRHLQGTGPRSPCLLVPRSAFQRTWSFRRHVVGDRPDHDVVRLSHQHVLLGDLRFLYPLDKRVGPVQHDVPGVLDRVRGQRVDHHRRDLVHEVVRLAGVQQACEAAHLAIPVQLTLVLLLLVPGEEEDMIKKRHSCTWRGGG